MDNDDDIKSFEEFMWLDSYAPRFEIDPNNIQILNEPKDFFTKLKEIFDKSKTRILISSLYLGTGELEAELIDTIEQNLKKNNNLTVKILFDYTRGLRGHKNSKTILQHLITEYENQVHAFFYHTPKLRGLTKAILPHRYNETIGLLHMKVYICDDTLVISGANLSHDYFLNRQDRYMVLENCPNICNFFDKLIDILSEFSFKVDSKGHMKYYNEHHPFEGEPHEFTHNLSSMLKIMLKEYMPKRIVEVNEHNNIENKTFVYPLLQITDAHLFTDELVTKQIFLSAPKKSTINLATGYFNLPHDYQHLIVLKSKSTFNLLMSSPEANGFFTANGVAQHIPKMYSYIEEQFYKYCSRHSQLNRIDLFEYKRFEWTYHGKGLWYYALDSKLPSFTIIGSSNYGHRSVFRDVEAQLAIFTTNKDLQLKLDMECKYLYKTTESVTEEIFWLPNRIASMPIRILSKFIKSYF